jgi:hypothetical protein
MKRHKKEMERLARKQAGITKAPTAAAKAGGK